jgi:L-threonylcarbamoyladenylate synthase
MEIIRFNLLNNWADSDNRVLEIAIGVIQRGGAVVYPTDTVYGLGVNALEPHGIGRLFKIKKRPETKPVPVMVRDIEMAKQLAFIDRRAEKILTSVWPGPVTVVLEKKQIVPDILTAGKRTIGLRIPDCQFTRALMENLTEPITVTSANFSGQPPLTSCQKVVKVFEKAYPRPDLILDTGDLPASPPSTVLDLTGSQPKITRVGPVNKKQLLKMFK